MAKKLETIDIVEKIADLIPDYPENEKKYNKYFTQLIELERQGSNILEVKKEVQNIIKHYSDEIRQQLPPDKNLAFIIGRTTAFLEDEIRKALADI